MPELTLYTRSGCPLCERMEDQLARLACQLPFRLIRIDLHDHPQLEARYGEWVPVLVAGDREICHYHLDEAALRGWFAQATV